MAGGHPTDEELLIAVREGEQRAFDERYTRFERRLFDRSYDPTRGRFSASLFSVARNRCLPPLLSTSG